MNGPAEIRDWYAARFERFEKGLNGASKTPLHALRRKAIASFTTHGFPTTADEEWRFTNVAQIAGTQFHPVLTQSLAGFSLQNIEPSPLLGVDGIVLVFLNGHYSPYLSRCPTLPAGVTVGNLSGALADDPALTGRLSEVGGASARDAFTALNTAFLIDGAYIRVDEGVTLDAPVHILSLAITGENPLLVQPRHLILAGKRARLSVVETYAGYGRGVYLTNAVTEIVVGEGGVVEHDKLQIESLNSYHVGTTNVSLMSKGSFTSNAINLGGALVRNNVRALFKGEHAECTLNGLSVATGTQLVDNHTVIDHATPHCESHELYKSVLDGSARGVFNGKIFVRQDAQKTDAKQTNKTLLLSDDATIDTKPQLEIFADDVKCTHGATVGQLDEDQVFYLRARGIGETEARDLLTFAFATDVINRVHVDALRLKLDALLHTRPRLGRVNPAA
jgi:Fe-S cluster assembly protein SufD